jgi:hypothetical protein
MYDCEMMEDTGNSNMHLLLSFELMVTVNEALETGSVIWSSNIKTMAKTYV